MIRKNADVFVATGLAVLAALVTLIKFPGGHIGIFLSFSGLVLVPGFLLSRILQKNKADPFEFYAESLVLGFSVFAILGLFFFFLRAPLKVVSPTIFLATIALAIIYLFYKKSADEKWEKISLRDGGGIGYAFVAVLAAAIVFSILLGAERGWAVEWDYYTYITMVRRIVTRGIVDNFPLTYANEGNDPVHSYNVWALMWAAISKSTGIDPVELYTKSAFCLVPAALLAFYSLAKSLSDTRTAMAATVCYAAYHFIAMGGILLGRTTFYNDDPAWLIFFPISMKFMWEYLNRGGKGELAAAILSAVATMLLHPFWGVLTVGGFMLGAIVWTLSARLPEKKSVKYFIIAAAALLIAPDGWAMYRVAVADTLEEYIGLSGVDFILPSILLGAPILLVLPWAVENIKNNSGEARRGLTLASIVFAASLPFALLRYLETKTARAEEINLIDGYHWFLTTKLYILHPGRFAYTAPDMDLFPWILLGAIAIPFLVVSIRNKNRASALILSGMLAIPLIAFHPYLSAIFSKFLHIAYLRRALRFPAMFGAIGAGTLLWEVARRSKKFNAAILVSLAIVAAVLSSLYPVQPSYFQGALRKSLFIIAHAPSDGLFWAPAENAHLSNDTAWDTENFKNLLDKVPLETTLTSDAFTSYRATAYRDIYVVARLKPSTGAADKVERELDSSALVTADTDVNLVCSLMKKYRSRYVLVNLSPAYKLRGISLWSPATVKTILESPQLFEIEGVEGEWALLETKPACVP